MIDRDVLDPRRTAFVVFDMMECYRGAAEQAGAIEPVRRVIDACRGHGVAVVYARADHREDGADYGQTLTDTDRSFRPWEPGEPQRRRFHSSRDDMAVLEELAPQPGDYDIPKHRWNAFFQTPLELSLRTRGVDTILLAGGSTHVGVASTAYAARDLDYNVVVVSDGCTGFAEQRELFLERVFPRMARVRTAGEVVAMLDQGADR